MRHRGLGDGEAAGGREDLRAILRQWEAPVPSPGIEAELRREFRRRRSQGLRPRVWLVLAAALLIPIALAARLLTTPGAKRPAPVAAPDVVLSRRAPAPPLVEPRRAAVPEPPPRNQRAKGSPKSRARSEVIVEPRQAELLAALARELRGTRQGGPGVSMPRLEVVPADAGPRPIRTARSYDVVRSQRSDWVSVGSEWPLAQWAPTPD
jgi:hypothetical protein